MNRPEYAASRRLRLPEDMGRILAASLLLLAAVTVPAAAEADLAPSGETECVRGGSCLLEVAIENVGDILFEGAAGLHGEFDPPLNIESLAAETPGLKCALAGESGYECLGAALSIEPGKAAAIQLVIDVPAEFPASAITHSRHMIWPAESPENEGAQNDRLVSTLAILDPGSLPAVDLSIAAAAPAESCAPGGQCRFSLAVTNNGPAAYEGPISVSYETEPEAAEVTVPGPSDWTCRTDDGLARCTLNDVALAPGDMRLLDLRVTPAPAAGGTLTLCAEVGRGIKALITEVQRALNAAGFGAGAVDGIAGRKTRAAIAAFQEANGLPATGEMDETLVETLRKDRPRMDASAQNDRACASLKTMALSVEDAPAENR